MRCEAGRTAGIGVVFRRENLASLPSRFDPRGNHRAGQDLGTTLKWGAVHFVGSTRAAFKWFSC